MVNSIRILLGSPSGSRRRVTTRSWYRSYNRASGLLAENPSKLQEQTERDALSSMSEHLLRCDDRLDDHDQVIKIDHNLLSPSLRKMVLLD